MDWYDKHKNGKLLVLSKVPTMFGVDQYMLDLTNYNLKDYWAELGLPVYENPEAPIHERILIGPHGDCEDFMAGHRREALLKGVPEECIWFGVCYVMGLGAHAVLIVEVDGDHYILDCRFRFVIPWNSHYLSIRRWFYVVRAKSGGVHKVIDPQTPPRGKKLSHRLSNMVIEEDEFQDAPDALVDLRNRMGWS